ncbi:ferritin-like domain-containing protein, partial [bacterium]|nr:ferritin-like domain-containing protein [bacterium]
MRPVKTKSNNRFPSAEQLEDEEQRALLLHFFANHELLAVELMALALLKFPDAPDSFRKGVLHTLQEEQNHTRWYMQRMKECGITFGDIQVSPMIWEHIADMESPLDYVSRLSLTFEQANLDYAKHYSQLLGQAGDTKSAKILDKVYHDEIAHVGHGLKWLRRWKENAQSDWDAWHKRLHIPLSPMRAKGMAPFNEEGRRKAGLN